MLGRETDVTRDKPRIAFTPQIGWQNAPAWGILLISAYLLLACLPVLLAWIAQPSPGNPFLKELGLGAVLLGFSLLTLQVVLAGRFHWLDRPFGLDVVMQFHKAMAILAGVLLLSHPVLLSLAAGGGHLSSLHTPWQVWLGEIALAVLVLGVGYALLVQVWRLEYQTWRRVHKGMIVILGLGFLHGVLLGHDLRDPMLLTYWSALFGAAMLVFAWRNAVIPIRGGRRFRVSGVRQASHDTYTIRLEPADDKPVPRWNPGQFMFLRLIRPGRSSEEHPFTISASPTEPGHLAATIKKSGDFTGTVDQTRPGDEARVEGPFGRLSYVYDDVKRFVFIAGGVGITPIRSMLRCLADSGDVRPAVLIYGNKAERDILFREEFDNLPGNVRVMHVLSKPDKEWAGPTGYVTREIIEEHAGDGLSEADVYLCGPPPMMNMAVKTLRELDVDPARIHYERFSL